LRIGICGLPDSVLNARTQHWAFKLGWSQEVLARRINSAPGILCLTPQRVDANLDSLRVLGFSSEEVIGMATRRPSLLTANWGTKLRLDKWHFIFTVVQLSLSAICANPVVLEASLRNKLVPRWQFLCDLASKGALTHHAPVYLLGCIEHVNQSDHQFARYFDKPDVDMVYNDAYKQACWEKYINEQ